TRLFEPLLHDFLGLHEPHPFVPPIFEQRLRDSVAPAARLGRAPGKEGGGGGVVAAPYQRRPHAAAGHRALADASRHGAAPIHRMFPPPFPVPSSVSTRRTPSSPQSRSSCSKIGGTKGCGS